MKKFALGRRENTKTVRIRKKEEAGVVGIFYPVLIRPDHQQPYCRPIHNLIICAE